MKKNRQDEIIRLITDKVIRTQEELTSALLADGFSVTQATVSRDIRALGLVKQADKDGTLRYVLPPKKTDVPTQTAIFNHSVIDVDSAENIVVLKCNTGTASAACAVLDTLNLHGIVGTIAGDDTIFILCRTSAIADNIFTKCKKFINK
jgi:transcriptional regulator of arginine metabolism